MTTQSLWFNNYMPYRKTKPGTICDPHLFNVGDGFTTNYTIFEWTIQSIETPNAAGSGVSYNGSSLTSCDVRNVYLNADLQHYSIDLGILMSCRNDNHFGVTASTSLTISSLPGLMSQMFGVAKAVNSNQTVLTDARPLILNDA